MDRETPVAALAKRNWTHAVRFTFHPEAPPFFSSTWPANKKARSMAFLHHDPHNERLRMHTIRDYIP